MATIARKALKIGAVAGTVPAACIALGYRMRAVQASENKQEGARVFKASDLPVYNLNSDRDTAIPEVVPVRNNMEEQIGTFRRSFEEYLEQYKGTYEDVKDTINIGVEHSKSTLDFVQNNPGELPRVAFITVGSLGGFILGYRGSLLRKLFYGSVVGVSCAALCYPKYTLEATQQVVGQITEGWSAFSSDELLKGNWPFVHDESTDEENMRKLGLAKNAGHPPKQVSNVTEQESGSPVAANLVQEATQEPYPPGVVIVEVVTDPPSPASPDSPVLVKGDPGQANPEDQDMYSTRSS